jgi:threonine aldolase
MKSRNFTSDNNAGMCPEALKDFIEANKFHAPAYGDDPFTDDAKESIQQWLDTRCDVHFVAGGTAANCIMIAASIRNYQSVICHEFSHIQNDECHAPGFFNPGVQLRPLLGINGKLKPSDFESVFQASHGVHGTLPGLVSVTQSTEAGTNYTLAELKSIADAAHSLGMLLHMDGARFSNALVSLGVTPDEMSWKIGVDLLSLGGVKNGLVFGEALVVFNPEAADRVDYRIKQSGQLSSKMRFLSAPWKYYLESKAWFRNAEHANRMAQLLAGKLSLVEDVRILFPIESNAVFCTMSEPRYRFMLDRGWEFYPFPQMKGYRLMCSWDTQPEDIDQFIEDLESSTQVSS